MFKPNNELESIEIGKDFFYNPSLFFRYPFQIPDHNRVSIPKPQTLPLPVNIDQLSGVLFIVAVLPVEVGDGDQGPGPNLTQLLDLLDKGQQLFTTEVVLIVVAFGRLVQQFLVTSQSGKRSELAGPVNLRHRQVGP